jgi:hypothetical protein
VGALTTRKSCHIIVALLAFSAAVLTNCSLFDTRNAESPDSGRHTIETPRVAQDVLDNMCEALSLRDNVSYMMSFDSSEFVFDADPTALARDPSLAPWGYGEEASYVQQLFSSAILKSDSAVFVTFTARREEPIDNNRVRITTRYDIAAGFTPSDIPHIAGGDAVFILHIGPGNYWQIVQWTDNRTGDQSTWSDIKSRVH